MTTNASKTQWKYLEQRPSSWRKQLHFKGRRLRPFTVWRTMQVEDMTPEEAAYDWDLSLDEVAEAIAYCEANQDLLKQDAEAERRYLEERGIDLEPRNQSSVNRSATPRRRKTQGNAHFPKGHQSSFKC